MKLILISILLFTNLGHLISQDFSQYDLKFTENNIIGNTNFGNSVSSAGDLNNDGFDDLIVGAYTKSIALIYFGGALLDTIPDLILTNEGGYFGYSVSTAGDVNGDGFDDVVIGDYVYNSKGRAYLYFGGLNMDNDPDIIFDGSDEISSFGWSVSGAGDVNNDGYDDLAIGAPYLKGKVYIFFGGSNMDNVFDIEFYGMDKSRGFGHQVSLNGDVNNDGFDDLIVSASHQVYASLLFNSGTGYVFMGDNNMDNEADVILDGNGRDDYFAYSTANAGDVNNDGFDDIIVGSFGSDNCYLYLGSSQMDSIPDVLFTSENENTNFGKSVSSTGDVNADGFDDILIGSEFSDNKIGKSFIFFGNTNINNISTLTFEGEKENSHFGNSVSYGGDIDNDGYDDVIIGSYKYDISTGRAYVYNGSAIVDTIADLTLPGIKTDNFFGSKIAHIGDANNDGYDDYMINATGFSNGKGRVYLYSGNNLFPEKPFRIIDRIDNQRNFGFNIAGVGDFNNDGYDDFITRGLVGFVSNYEKYECNLFLGGTSIDLVSDQAFFSDISNDSFGSTISGFGDINGDTFSDILIGAMESTVEKVGINAGKCYIYFGNTNSSNTEIITLNGEEPYDYFGKSIATNGDINNDGFSDVLISAIGDYSTDGKCYIYFGGAPFDTVPEVILPGKEIAFIGDINNDSFSDFVIPSTNNLNWKIDLFYGGLVLDTIPDLTLKGENLHTMGIGITEGIGDFNSDGFDDLLIGVNDWPGRAYVYLGGTSLDTIPDFTIIGEGNRNTFAWSLSILGDVNNDKYDDFMISDIHNEFNGATYLYSGQNFMTSIKTFKEVYPNTLKLFQNYPNPFNSSTIISYHVPKKSKIKLNIYNALGQLVRKLVNERQLPGNYSIIWNGKDNQGLALSSGIYFYNLVTEVQNIYMKMLIIK
ncbi:MAG: T9SS type A sorting domain-containing protein [Calditrichaeota bacterium]|nr:T9SS type A sorting domain-containing protein [Calditrichota bacterium]